MGILLIAGYVLLIRYELSIVPLTVGSYHALNAVEEGVHQAYAAASPGSVLAVILMIWISILWSGKLPDSSSS
jgi:hypothetical protein